MTPQWITLSLSNGQQVIPLIGGNIGFQFIALSPTIPPSAGTVKIEYLPPGATTWITPPSCAAISLLAPVAVSFYAVASSYRLTISGLVGGSGLQMFSAPVPVQGFPDGAFTGFRALTIQSYTEANVKNGVQFEAGALTLALGAGASINTIFTTGAKPVIIKNRQVGFDGVGLTARVFRSPTFTGGSAVGVFNLNDINPVVTTISLLSGATVSNNGIEFGAPTFAIGSKLQGQSVQGTYSVLGQERILRANTAYLLQITSDDTVAQRVSTYLTWYEGSLDLPLAP